MRPCSTDWTFLKSQLALVTWKIFYLKLFPSPLSSSIYLIARLVLSISIPNWGIVLPCSPIIYQCPCLQWLMKTYVYTCEVLQKSYQFGEKKYFKVSQVNKFKFYLYSFNHELCLLGTFPPHPPFFTSHHPPPELTAQDNVHLLNRIISK